MNAIITTIMIIIIIIHTNYYYSDPSARWWAPVWADFATNIVLVFLLGGSERTTFVRFSKPPILRREGCERALRATLRAIFCSCCVFSLKLFELIRVVVLVVVVIGSEHTTFVWFSENNFNFAMHLLLEIPLRGLPFEMKPCIIPKHNTHIIGQRMSFAKEARRKNAPS